MRYTFQQRRLKMKLNYQKNKVEFHVSLKTMVKVWTVREDLE